MWCAADSEERAWWMLWSTTMAFDASADAEPDAGDSAGAGDDASAGVNADTDADVADAVSDVTGVADDTDALQREGTWFVAANASIGAAATDVTHAAADAFTADAFTADALTADALAADVLAADAPAADAFAADAIHDADNAARDAGNVAQHRIFATVV